MKGSKSLFIGLAVLAAIILIIVLWITAIIGAMNLTDGCLYRYNFDKDKSISNSSKVTNTITLKANGNYTITTDEEASEAPSLDPDAYGKWLNTNLRLDANQTVKLTVKGDVSLCRAYIPENNLQSLSNKDRDGKLIPIPRVDEKILDPISLIFDAKTDEWRNITELFENDHVLVSISQDKITNLASSQVYSSIAKRLVNADCKEGMKSYSPICGRYSVWQSQDKYVDKCFYKKECQQKCTIDDWCIFRYTILLVPVPPDACLDCEWIPCYEATYDTILKPYSNKGIYNVPRSDDINNLIPNFDRNCENEHQYVNGEDYQKKKKYIWFSADDASGLLTRIDSSLKPSNAKDRGSNLKFAQISKDQSHLAGDKNYKIIFNEIYKENNIGYLQYRFLNKGSFTNNTGGYVLNIRHTKCRHTNGSSVVGSNFAGRGAVEYVVASYGKNPNNDSNNLSTKNILVDSNGSGEIKTNNDQEGYLWLRIKNNEADYKESFGQYQVSLESTIKQSGFYYDVLNPFFEGIKGKIKQAAITIFKNMTCYKGAGEAGSCTNFFSYIKAILTLYIMLYGASFLLGIVKINQTDLVIRVVKISIVAGLLNDSTFEFFNSYVFDFVTGFSDNIISNMSGYSMFSGATSVSNPFMFLNEVMSKIFLSSTFSAQMMAMLSMGFGGLIYFILVFVTICIIVVVLLKAIAIYLMAFMAIAVLIGLAPLFLTFILFERTWYLFDHWLKFMFRYMLEPVIMLAGIIILTQLFTIYLDQVVGYSVCWKCAIPFKIPFVNIKGVTPAFLDVELFCINWFAPWGFDHRNDIMGINMQNIVALMMLAYCMWGYIDFSGRIVARIAGGTGGPSASRMGNALYSSMKNNALSKVGLDQKSRQEIKQATRARLKSMAQGDRKAPISTGSRDDKAINTRNIKSEPNIAKSSELQASRSSPSTLSSSKPSFSSADSRKTPPIENKTHKQNLKSSLTEAEAKDKIWDLVKETDAVKTMNEDQQDIFKSRVQELARYVNVLGGDSTSQTKRKKIIGMTQDSLRRMIEDVKVDPANKQKMRKEIVEALKRSAKNDKAKTALEEAFPE